MKEAVNERVRQIIAEKNFSSVYLSSISDIHQTTIARQISGKCSVSIELLYAILHECPDISPGWLLMGEGNKYVADNLPAITGNESEEVLDLHAQIAKLTAERDAALENLRREEESIKDLRYTVELQKSLLHGSHEDYIEERKKKEIV